MDKDSDPDPLDPNSGGSGNARRRGIPEASDGKKKVMKDLSGAKQGLPSFSKQKVQSRESLDEIDPEAEPQNVEPERRRRKAKPEPVTPQVVATVEDEAEIRDPSLARRTTENVAAEQKEEGKTGNEQEEELRRQGGRPKSVRAADFEPEAWGSSEMRVDRGDFDEDEEPQEQAGGLAACLSPVTNGLKGFWSRLNVFEMASVAVFLVVALIGLSYFRGLVHSGPEPEPESGVKLSDIAFPAKGGLLTLSSVEAYWRPAKAGDLVRPGQVMIPEVTIALGNGTGYLRVIFRGENGKIRGDTFTQQVTGGKANGSGSFTALCSEGYRNVMKLLEVQSGRLVPWTVEIFETKEWDVPLEEWNLLAGFDMPSKPKSDPPS